MDNKKLLALIEIIKSINPENVIIYNNIYDRKNKINKKYNYLIYKVYEMNDTELLNELKTGFINTEHLAIKKAKEYNEPIIIFDMKILNKRDENLTPRGLNAGYFFKDIAKRRTNEYYKRIL